MSLEKLDRQLLEAVEVLGSSMDDSTNLQSLGEEVLLLDGSIVFFAQEVRSCL